MPLLALLLASPGLAATWTVEADGSGDLPTLAAAVAAATSGDEILLGAGSFAGGVSLGNKALTITGAGADATTITGPGAAEAALQLGAGGALSELSVENIGGSGVLQAGGTLTLSGVLLRDLGGSALDGGAVRVAGGRLVLVDVEIDGGTARNGMIHLADGTSLDATGTTFEGAEVSSGGAVYATGAALSLTDCTLRDLYAADSGGALWLSGATVTASDTLFEGNLTDAGDGGAIHAASSVLTLDGGELSLNFASDYTAGHSGGAIYAYDSALTATGTEFSGNIAYLGGAVRAQGGDLVFDGVELVDNFAYYAGAVRLDAGATLSDTDGQWRGNTGYSSGGGLFAYGDGAGFSVSLDGTSFEGNGSTYGYGAAAMLQQPGSSTWTGVTVSDNTAYYGGGGAFIQYSYGAHRFEDCAFDGNEATNSAGGAVMLQYYNDAVFEDCSFTGNTSAVNAGGAVYSLYTDLVIRRATFSGNQAESYQGGALYSYNSAAHGGTLWVEDSDFTSNAAQYHGGAISSIYDEVTLRGNRFHVNDTDGAGFGGAVFLSNHRGASAWGNTFSGNNAGYGGAVYDDEATAVSEWTHNLFMENTAGTGGAMVLANNPGTTLRNNAFVGNSAVGDAGILGLVQAAATVVNNAFSGSTHGAAIHAWDGNSVGTSSVTYNAFYEVADGVAGGALTSADLGEGNLLDTDPLFAAYSPDGDPDNDVLVLLRDSPLIDAGDPEVSDPDLSRSDIGLWGGPDLQVEDADADGFDSWIDCDDTEPAAHPAGVETWYDGINGDCLSGSDDDADGDGEDSSARGGSDCDDQDPTVQSGCDEADTGTTDTGRPPMPAGDGEGASAGCSCASTSAAPGVLWAGLFGLLALGRRRR